MKQKGRNRKQQKENKVSKQGGRTEGIGNTGRRWKKRRREKW